MKIIKGGFRTKFVIKFGKTIKSKKLLCIFIFPYTLIKYLILRITSKEKKSYSCDFAICAIFKNEALYLEEWIEYHRFIGINKFYLYNNNSNDNYMDILKPYIQKNIVELKEYPGDSKQMDAYNDCLMKHKKDTKYILFIDIDEFIFDKDFNALNKVNDTFSNNKLASAIQINWMIFGSSNEKLYVAKPVLKRFQYRSKIDFDMNKHTKSIVNPRRTLCFLNPHFSIPIGKYVSINIHGETLNGALNNNFKENDLRINHYFSKSKEEFILKRQRGCADGNPIRSLELFDYHDKNDCYDDSMKYFYEKYEK